MSKRKQEKHVRWDVSLRSFNRRQAEGKWCRTHLFGRRLNVSVSCLLVSRIIVLFLPLSSLKTLIFFTITTDISFTHIQHSLHQFCSLHSSFPSSSLPSFNYLLHRIPFPSFAIEFFPVRFVSGFDIDVCLLSPSLVFLSVLSFTPLLPTERETCFGEFCYESPSSPGVVSISLRFFLFLRAFLPQHEVSVSVGVTLRNDSSLIPSSTKSLYLRILYFFPTPCVLLLCFVLSSLWFCN